MKSLCSGNRLKWWVLLGGSDETQYTGARKRRAVPKPSQLCTIVFPIPYLRLECLVVDTVGQSCRRSNWRRRVRSDYRIAVADGLEIEADATADLEGHSFSDDESRDGMKEKNEPGGILLDADADT